MGIEIERKYLVKNSDYKDMSSMQLEIRQGYLQRQPERVVRVRIKDTLGYITIKGITTGCTRKEYEYEIPLIDAKEMLEMCLPPVISKTRYIVPYHGRNWEVDEFHGDREGLVVAEIEMECEDAPLELPPFIGENVTGDPQYYNSNL